MGFEGVEKCAVELGFLTGVPGGGFDGGGRSSGHLRLRRACKEESLC